MEKIISKLKAVSSLLVYMTYAEDNIENREYAMSLLASIVGDCVKELEEKQNEQL